VRAVTEPILVVTGYCKVGPKYFGVLGLPEDHRRNGWQPGAHFSAWKASEPIQWSARSRRLARNVRVT
jgi:hypothetical protein